MANEKTKEHKINAPENIKKTKRNRRKTECSINRMRGCGICGSLNIATQGVKYCGICGKEAEYLSQEEFFAWRQEASDMLCDCTYVFNGRRYRNVRYIEVKKCMDCGSVKSMFCPNCNQSNVRVNSRNCWKSWDGKKFCQSCGYRKN